MLRQVPHWGTAHGLGLVEKYLLQVSLPITWQIASIIQPDRLCDTCRARHDDVGVTTVERSDPKDLSIFN